MYCAAWPSAVQAGDRFYYEYAGAGGFSEPQLAELRRASLARVTCDNGDNIKLMQPLAFRAASPALVTIISDIRNSIQNIDLIVILSCCFRNPLVPCDAITIPLISLAPWQESYHAPAPTPASQPAKLSRVSPYNFHHKAVYATSRPYSPYKPEPSAQPYTPYKPLHR